MSSTTTTDPRLEEPAWSGRPGAHAAARVRIMALLALPLALWYFGWLLEPGRIPRDVELGPVGRREWQLLQASRNFFC